MRRGETESRRCEQCGVAIRWKSIGKGRFILTEAANGQRHDPNTCEPVNQIEDAPMMALSTKAKTCNICGATAGANGLPFVWRQIAPKLFRYYETDQNGKPTVMHPCHAKLPNHGANVTTPTPAYTPPAAFTGPGNVPPIQPTTPASAPVPAGSTIDQTATQAAREQAADLAAMYDTLDQFDKDQAAREPNHVDLGLSYAPIARREDGAWIPTIEPHYMAQRAMLDTLITVVQRATRTGIPQNIALYGPPGSGKSTLAVQLGAIFNRPTFIIDSSDKQTADEWFGTSTLENGSIRFIETDFIRAIETPNAIVVLDDVNLFQARTVQNGLNAILDPTRRAIYVHSIGREIIVARGVVIIGTWNKDTVSSSTMSEQIISRFRAGCMFEVDYPSNETLIAIIRAQTGINLPMAARLANMVDWFRADSDPIAVDTRSLIACANLIVDGRPLGYAIAHVILADLGEDEKARAFGIISVQLSEKSADESEQRLWDTPVSGDYVALGDVSRLSGLATEPTEPTESEQGS